MIQLFISDLDGTLLNENHQSDEKILKGLQTLKQKGRLFAIATGRNLEWTKNTEIPFDYAICMNGSLIIDKEFNTIYTCPLEKHWVREIYERFTDLPLEFQTPEGVWVPCTKEVYLKALEKKNKARGGSRHNLSPEEFIRGFRFEIPLETLLEVPVMKINCSDDHGLRCQDLHNWTDLHQEDLINAGSDAYIMEITMRQANKGDASRQLAGFLNIPEEQVNVYGDGGNDIPMLEAFENSFCPADGQPIALKTAKHVIGTNKEYGVIEHMLQSLEQD